MNAPATLAFMHSEATAIVVRARSLLRTYELALHDSGAQVAELADAGICSARIASLFPYAGEEWEVGYRRLTREPHATSQKLIHLGESSNGEIKQSQRRPAAISQKLIKDLRRLASLLPPEAPALSQTVRHNYTALSRRFQIETFDPRVQLEYIVWHLHVLATSPNARERLEAELATDLAVAVLDAATALSQDSRFEASGLSA